MMDAGTACDFGQRAEPREEALPAGAAAPGDHPTLGTFALQRPSPGGFRALLPHPGQVGGMGQTTPFRIPFGVRQDRVERAPHFARADGPPVGIRIQQSLDGPIESLGNLRDPLAQAQAGAPVLPPHLFRELSVAERAFTGPELQERATERVEVGASIPRAPAQNLRCDETPSTASGQGSPLGGGQAEIDQADSPRALQDLGRLDVQMGIPTGVQAGEGSEEFARSEQAAWAPTGAVPVHDGFPAVFHRVACGAVIEVHETEGANPVRMAQALQKQELGDDGSAGFLRRIRRRNLEDPSSAVVRIPDPPQAAVAARVERVDRLKVASLTIHPSERACCHSRITCPERVRFSPPVQRTK